MGPRSRELLARLTDADLDDAAFPFATAQRIDVGWATASPLRVSFAGELGWELYAPVESLPALFDQLRARPGAGSGCASPATTPSTACAPRRASCHWGADIGPADTPSRGRPARGPSRSTSRAGSSVARRCARAPGSRRAGGSCT